MSPGPGTCHTLIAKVFVSSGAPFHSIGGEKLDPSPVNSVGMLPPGSNAGLVTINSGRLLLGVEDVCSLSRGGGGRLPLPGGGSSALPFGRRSSPPLPPGEGRRP